jgi:LacI family transcriptional regulator
VARARQTAVFVTSLGHDPAGERGTVESLLGRQVAGLISTPVGADQGYLKPWQARTTLVFIDRAPVGIKADSVVEDDEGGAHAATTHLIEQGHRRIGFIGDMVSIATTGRRLQGYRAAHADAGLAVDPETVAVGVTSSAEAGAAARHLMALPHPPTAVLSSNARCSIAVVPVLQALARTDVALVSFGDFPLADALDPALTVVDQDPAAVGEVAATRLFERMDHPNRRLKRQIVLPVELVVRSSTAVDLARRRVG